MQMLILFYHFRNEVHVIFFLSFCCWLDVPGVITKIDLTRKPALKKKKRGITRIRLTRKLSLKKKKKRVITGIRLTRKLARDKD